MKAQRVKQSLDIIQTPWGKATPSAAIVGSGCGSNIMKLSIIVLIVRDAKSGVLKAYAVQRDAEGVLNIGRNLLSGKQVTKVESAKIRITEALRGKYSRLEFC